MRKLNFQQQVLAGFVATLVIIFILAAVSYIRIRKLQDDAEWVDHAYSVLVSAGKIESQMLAAESLQRYYVMAGGQSVAGSVNQILDSAKRSADELGKLLENNSESQALTDTLAFLVTEKVAVIQNIVETRERSEAEALSLVRAGINQGLTEKIRSTIDRIKDMEMLLLAQREQNRNRSVQTLIWTAMIGCFVILMLVLNLSRYIRRTFREQSGFLAEISSINRNLETVSAENSARNWVLTGSARLDEVMRGQKDVETLAGDIITSLSQYIDAHVAAIYLTNRQGTELRLAGSYAFEFRKGNNRLIKPGEGMVGQAAKDKKRYIFTDVPPEYVKVVSALGEMTPHTILVQPFMFDDEVKGVIEFGFITELTQQKLDFIDMVLNALGVAVNTVQSNVQLQLLFEETQQQAEELETQQEELRTTNEELLLKTNMLQASEEELRVQQEELRQANAELEEKAELLEEKNRTVEQARIDISSKAEELEQSSKYKSEFLANMSHELRTPLNSILILARILKENKYANMNEEQVKYAGVIHAAGNDLLTLINDILDLSKIESGKLDLEIEGAEITEIRSDIESLFNELARSKKIDFRVDVADTVTESLFTDKLRLEQILKNLLSNAFKFTKEGGTVSLDISYAGEEVKFKGKALANSREKVLAFAVSDTGIGIAREKQEAIFEAFQQADGSTSRKFGGTGLGLSISRELAVLLGGEIQLISEEGKGSTFTLYIPQERKDPAAAAPPVVQEETVIRPAKTAIAPPRVEREIPLLLIVEDDEHFADVLKNYTHERGYEPLVAHNGNDGLRLAQEHLPDAVILDIKLPGMDGWQVLKKLKADDKTRHIPVHMMSASDIKSGKAEREGALGFLRKPVENEKLARVFDSLIGKAGFDNLRKVLVVEDEKIQSEIITKQLSGNGIEVVQAFSGDEALQLLGNGLAADCIILDINLPDISGIEVLDRIKDHPEYAQTPVIINTSMDLSQEQVARIMKHSQAMVHKSNKSNERLLDEVNLFMHKLQTAPNGLRSGKQQGGKVILETVLKGKKVLIVDDDMRNIFALSSALQDYDISIEMANNGQEALQALERVSDINLVLMDIMMPEMDGYEAMREIRKRKEWGRLPVIALTAKAMKADREKCIEAGANDYISKPVDMDKLISLMRVWLS